MKRLRPGTVLLRNSRAAPMAAKANHDRVVKPRKVCRMKSRKCADMRWLFTHAPPEITKIMPR
jgi:hypothetical protein